jgi:hypothetical protein
MEIIGCFLDFMVVFIVQSPVTHFGHDTLNSWLKLKRGLKINPVIPISLQSLQKGENILRDLLTIDHFLSCMHKSYKVYFQSGRRVKQVRRENRR